MADRPSARSQALEYVSLLLTIAVCVTLLYRAWKPASTERGRPRSLPDSAKSQPLPTTPIPIAGAAVLGDSRARVALVIFSDFQCPYCARFAKTVWPFLEQSYVNNGRIVVAFKHLPLPIHPFANSAAAAAECAGEQGRFWPMHNLLFAETAFDEASLRARAAKLSLKGDLFEKCLLSPSTKARIGQDADLARELQIGGTPTFVLGVRNNELVTAIKRWSGAGSIQVFKDAIEAALGAASR